ncbi:MAG: TIGR02281 family clan AA aspartic protease [Tepidisphaeraceae bacterium]
MSAADKFLGKYDRWEAYRTVNTSGDSACFVSTLPSKTIGRLGRQSEAALTIAHFPKRKAFGQVRVKVGVALKSGTPLELAIGTKRFKLATDGDSGFGATAKDNDEILAAIKFGQTAAATSVPAGGLRIVDTYALGGMSEALAVISKECGDERAHEIRQSPDGHYYVNALVNDADVRLLVDTGATVTVLSVSHARSAGISPNPSDYTASVRTASGHSIAAPIRIRELRIGGALLENEAALVMATPGDISVLGAATLQRFRSYEVRDRVLTLRW